MMGRNNGIHIYLLIYKILWKNTLTVLVSSYLGVGVSSKFEICIEGEQDGWETSF